MNPKQFKKMRILETKEKSNLKWKLEKAVPPKKRVRSNMDRLRVRLEVLENDLVEFIKSFKSIYYQNDYGQLIYAYLSWTQHQIRNFELGEVDTNNEYFIQQLSSFELKVRYALSSLNKQRLNSNKKVVKLYTLNQPQFQYGTFLQQGIKVFIGVIDAYGLWIKPNEILPLITTEEPLSFVFIAVLARYTLNRNEPGYKYIYGNALRNIKARLPDMYLNPSINNIIAFGLLTYIMMLHFKINLASRYFTMAVRMADTLGLKQPKLIEDKILEQKGNTVMNALSLTYLVLSSIAPDIPYVNFVPNDFYLNDPSTQNLVVVSENQHDLTELKDEKFFSTDVGAQLTRIFIKINTYSQKVKARFLPNDIENVTNDELRLPDNQFNKVVTELLGLEPDKGMTNTKVKPTYDNIYFKIIYHLQIMNLYYPIGLIYPKPVKFNLSEMRLLFRAANQFFIEYNNLLKYYDDQSKDKAIVFKQHDDNKIQVKFGSPHYLQTLACIMVWLNCLDLNNDYQLEERDLKLCQSNCIDTFRMLYQASKKAKVKMEDDAKFTLDRVKGFIHRFLLLESFLSRIIIYFED